MNNENTALLVIDMQTGIFAKTTKVYKEDLLIENTNSLIDAFHEKSGKVYFIRHTNKNILAVDSDDWQIHPELNKRDDDIFINKAHSSAFKENNIEKELNNAGIEHIISQNQPFINSHNRN